MKRRTSRALPAGLERIQRRFERWRETRRGRSRIPESLWSLAAGAALEFGVSRTSRALRLNSAVLKGRTEARSSGGAPLPGFHSSFVELIPAGGGCRSECVVEIEEPTGLRMRIELKGVAASDVVTLTRSLRGIGA